MRTFTYHQVGLLDRDEPLKEKESWWGFGKYPMRHFVRFTLLDNDKMIHHGPRITSPDLFQIQCESILEADKAFEAALGFRADKPYGTHTVPVTVTISQP